MKSNMSPFVLVQKSSGKYIRVDDSGIIGTELNDEVSHSSIFPAIMRDQMAKLIEELSTEVVDGRPIGQIDMVAVTITVHHE